MRLSKNFTRTIKQAPADEVARNAQLLIRAGYVHKTMAGVYSYLPLGLKVVENIKQIVREEMNKIDSQELVMSTLQRKETWQETGRWSDELVDVWFKSHLQDGTEVGFGWTHEEPIVDLLRNYLKSYKDLPISVYQFQNKLRNELRAKSGIMRGREFVMKDMYSVHASKEDLDNYYNAAIEAYKRCYDRFGIGDETYVTFASGGAFTKFSHAQRRFITNLAIQRIGFNRANNRIFKYFTARFKRHSTAQTNFVSGAALNILGVLQNILNLGNTRLD